MSKKQSTKRKWLYWTRDMIEKFIELLKENECFYNNKNKSYYNRQVKDEICESILREMQKDKPAIQIADIRRKMKVLRTQYARENRMLALSRLHGKEYEPKLWCYNKLSFLEKHTTCVTSLNKNKKDVGTSNDETNTFSDDEPINYDEDNSLLLEIYKKEDMVSDNAYGDLQYEDTSKPTETAETGDEASYTTPKTDTFKSNDNSKNRKYEWVGDLVVSQIEDIDLDHRGDLIWDIQCLLRKYLLKSKPTKEKSQPKKSNETADTSNSQDITFNRGSNISINVNFL